MTLAAGLAGPAHAQFLGTSPAPNPYAGAAMWADAARSRHAAAQNVLAGLPDDECAHEVRRQLATGADLDGLAVENAVEQCHAAPPHGGHWYPGEKTTRQQRAETAAALHDQAAARAQFLGAQTPPDSLGSVARGDRWVDDGQDKGWILHTCTARDLKNGPLLADMGGIVQNKAGVLAHRPRPNTRP